MLSYHSRTPFPSIGFSFYFFDTFSQNFSKIDQLGDFCKRFINERSKKLEDIEFLFC